MKYSFEYLLAHSNCNEDNSALWGMLPHEYLQDLRDREVENITIASGLEAGEK